MKERIEQLAAGEVLVKKPELDFSPAYLEGRVEAGTVQNKELVIRVRNRVPFKGFFYSTNERVKIETKQAAGQSAAVLFEINTIDLKSGDEITGAVVVVGNAGEQKIEYHYSVGEASGQKAMPHTLTEFGAFYLENPSQARHLFVSDKFKELDFMKDQVQRTALYEGLLEGSSEHQALEAFAVAMELKKPVQLTVQAKTLSFTEEELPQDGIELVVTASTWGWFAAQIKMCHGLFFLKKRLHRAIFQISKVY